MRWTTKLQTIRDVDVAGCYAGLDVCPGGGPATGGAEPLLLLQTAIVDGLGAPHVPHSLILHLELSSRLKPTMF